jgi:hypothetical protein
MFTLPLYWELAQHYSADNQLYYFMSLHWWPKGANFILEAKYHLVR